jgi:hypothetical protein
MSDDESFADGIRELLRNHNLSSSSFIRSQPCSQHQHGQLAANYISKNKLALYFQNKHPSFPSFCSEEDIIKGAAAASRSSTSPCCIRIHCFCDAEPFLYPIRQHEICHVHSVTRHIAAMTMTREA